MCVMFENCVNETKRFKIIQCGECMKHIGREQRWKYMCVCVPMPTHCTITCFGFHAKWIDGVKCGLFFNHAPLGQTTLPVG